MRADYGCSRAATPIPAEIPVAAPLRQPPHRAVSAGPPSRCRMPLRPYPLREAHVTERIDNIANRVAFGTLWADRNQGETEAGARVLSGQRLCTGHPELLRTLDPVLDLGEPEVVVGGAGAGGVVAAGDNPAHPSYADLRWAGSADVRPREAQVRAVLQHSASSSSSPRSGGVVEDTGSSASLTGPQ